MDPILLARLQFALTIGFHFIFPPLTIGLAWLIVWIMVRLAKTGDETYRAMARFWVRVFALSFAVGVATGITMEFQFGTNWAAYARYVGDIFGAPLAAEGIFAFFLESTFMGLLIFGEKRLSPRMHVVSALMVALGSTMSAFWIKLFTTNFAIGVATGITMEFAFGTNWADYSRFVGNIFGAPLAAEGLFAFFLESTFLGVLLFGRKRVSRGLYYASA